MSAVPRVAAVIVTHNRRALLEQCLERIGEQSRLPDLVLVVDNASTDGTRELLAARDEVEGLRLEENRGGAGGFHAGLRLAAQRGHDWIWLMDDDTMPEIDALERLLEAGAVATGLSAQVPLVLASRVEWTDGSLHPMNRPWPKHRAADETVDAARAGLMPLRAASFVSVLIHREAVLRYGLPHPEYFIYNDDLEYTARILRHDVGYWVPASLAIHATGQPRMPADAGRDRYFFDVRNRILMIRGSSWSWSEKRVLIHHLLYSLREYLRAQHFAPGALITVARAVLAGTTRRRPTRRGA